MGVELPNKDHDLQEDEENLDLKNEKTEYYDFIIWKSYMRKRT